MLVALLGIFTTSCEDKLDINKDPLVATSADPNVLLPFVIAQYSNRHTTELGTRIMDVPQHFTACFNSPRAGNTSIFLTGNTWNMMYTQALGNLQLIEEDAVVQGPTFNNAAAIAKVLKANVYFELTSCWEAAPFSEALNPKEFPSPTFDDQETMLRGCLDILDEAITLIDGIPAEGNFDISSGDIIYKGDMESWRRYANSLRLRILMILRNKVDVVSEITAALASPMIENNSQSALVLYSNDAGQRNGYNSLVEAFFGISNEVQGVFAPSRTLYNLLVGDPRFDVLIAGSGDPLNIGQFAFSLGGPTISDNVIRDNLPHMLFMPAEINLYRAELAMASGDMTTADAQYRNGIANNIAWWGGDIPGNVLGIDAAAAATFVDGLSAPTMEDIHNQLYIESFIRPMVAWNTVRRTNTPVLEPVPGSNISTILKRFNYAPDEVAANPNTPANELTDKPMWFEN